MAESEPVLPAPLLSTAGPGSATTFPDTPTSITSTSAGPTTAEAGNFLKPTSPGKRRHSVESPSTRSTTSLSRKANLSTPSKASSPPKPLTAAAELTDQKRRRLEKEKEEGRLQSPNPQMKALGALLGSDSRGMSRVVDAPSSATTLSAAVAAVAPVISIPSQAQGENSIQASPASTASFATLDSTATTTLTAGAPQVASPGHIAETNEQNEEQPPQGDTLSNQPEEGSSHRAVTYPGPLLSPQNNDGRRGMSFPGLGLRRDDSRSPSSGNKKHKCNHCSTEFTRHHNLKSHLLTHSQEKPYPCPTCDSRFRRLHDLKRHTKLHTGERPHVCPKCKRSFARGDALARHNKGQGGCASTGRRSSAGSYIGEGTGQDEGNMEGVMYTDEASHEPETMDEDAEGVDDRGQSLPSIRRHDAPPDPHYRPGDHAQSGYAGRQPSTYPPVAARQSTIGGLYPPSAGHGGSGSSGMTSPGTSYPPGPATSSPYQTSGSNVFHPGGMTESPKPLSPGGMNAHQLGHSRSDSSIHRNRSPSLSQQLQQQQFSRRAHSRGTPPPPPMGLPPPITGGPHPHPHGPHLPSLPGLTPPDPRFTLHSQSSGASHTLPSSTHPPSHNIGGPSPTSYHSHQGAISSASNSLSSHGTQGHGSGERANLPYPQGDERIWTLVRTLEAKVDRLQEEVISLRSQLGSVPQHR